MNEETIVFVRQTMTQVELIVLSILLEIKKLPAGVNSVRVVLGYSDEDGVVGAIFATDQSVAHITFSHPCDEDRQWRELILLRVESALVMSSNWRGVINTSLEIRSKYVTLNLLRVYAASDACLSESEQRLIG